MQNECKNPLLCYVCHDTGHISTHCPMAEAWKNGINMFGFGLPGLGFYHL
jgi:hypothetical protein